MVSEVETVTVWKQADSLAIVIPKKIARELGIEVGNKLVMRTENNEIRIKKLEW